jgi:hypothetical protein
MILISSTDYHIFIAFYYTRLDSFHSCLGRTAASNKRPIKFSRRVGNMYILLKYISKWSLKVVRRSDGRRSQQRHSQCQRRRPARRRRKSPSERSPQQQSQNGNVPPNLAETSPVVRPDITFVRKSQHHRILERMDKPPVRPASAISSRRQWQPFGHHSTHELHDQAQKVPVSLLHLEYKKKTHYRYPFYFFFLRDMKFIFC